MKLHFFGKENPVINERLCIYIFSLLNSKLLAPLQLVNREWKTVVDKTKRNVALLPTIQRIPQLSEYSLAKMGIKAMSGGMTNCTFKLKIDKNKWVLRVPGKGSSVFINRKDEAYNAKQASSLELNVTIDFFDGKDGLQLTRYLDDNQPITKFLLEEPNVIQAIAKLLKYLHSSNSFHNTIHVFARNKELLEKLKANNKDILPDGIDEISIAMEQIESLFKKYRIEMKPCHNDTTPGNFLLSGRKDSPEKKLKLLDWEYSGDNDFLWDLVYFALESKLTREQEKNLLSSYFGECNESILAWFDLYKPVVEWWITIWSWTQIASQADASDVGAYRDLANACYNNTKMILASEEFKHALNVIESDIISKSFTGMRPF